MAGANEQFVSQLVAGGALRTPALISAFQKIDRADFVPARCRKDAYEDFPIPLGFGATISQPSTVAFMLEKLQPLPGEKILDVGSGSGWVTALLGALVGPTGEVYGVEIVPELVVFGRKNAQKYRLPWIKILPAGAALGLPGQAPFAKILVSAAAETLPQALIQQLRVGGRLVLPIRNSIWQIDKVSADKIQRREFPGFVFVPLQ